MIGQKELWDPHLFGGNRGKGIVGSSSTLEAVGEEESC